MNEMKIKLFMDDNKNITVTNLTSNKHFIISYSDKTILAPNIYNILDYKLNNTYELESNIQDITDENDNNYFSDIIALLDDIKNEINEMVENSIDETDNIEEDSSDSNEVETTEETDVSFDDFPF